MGLAPGYIRPKQIQYFIKTISGHSKISESELSFVNSLNTLLFLQTGSSVDDIEDRRGAPSSKHCLLAPTGSRKSDELPLLSLYASIFVVVDEGEGLSQSIFDPEQAF